jgi:hypothetical protein
MGVDMRLTQCMLSGANVETLLQNTVGGIEAIMDQR